MPFEIDHLFICTTVGAPEADCLIDFGLTEGPPNVHAGQGTANRRFFFRNAMLELLWVCNPTEAQAELTRPTRLWERWSNRGDGACPFGLCFRPLAPPEGKTPFPAWEYRPQYLPPGVCLHIATNSHVLSEPLLVYLAFGQRLDRNLAVNCEPFQHATTLSEISRVELVSPCAQNLSPELEVLANSNVVNCRQGEKYLMQLGFDGETRGKRVDFRPSLPLMFYW